MAVALSKNVYDKLPEDERESPWLASTVFWRRGRTRGFHRILPPRPGA